MRRLAAILTTLTILVVAAGPTAWATDARRADYHATGLAGHPDPIVASVLDVTFSRERGAREVHRVVGAAPSTSYELVADIAFAPECVGPTFPVAEGTLGTDAQGNGLTTVVFGPGSFDTAPPTFWVRWSLRARGATAYVSDCVRVDL